MNRIYEFKVKVGEDVQYIFVKAQTMNEALIYCNSKLQDEDIGTQVRKEDCIFSEVFNDIPHGVFEFIG